MSLDGAMNALSLAAVKFFLRNAVGNPNGNLMKPMCSIIWCDLVIISAYLVLVRPYLVLIWSLFGAYLGQQVPKITSHKQQYKFIFYISISYHRFSLN